MTDIEVQKDKAIAQRHWDPFRVMRELMRWDPFTSARFEPEGASFWPAFDVKETPEAFVFKADMPGIKTEDIDLQLAQNRLIVSGKREAEKTQKGETLYAYERTVGSFTRAFTLPEGVDADKIHAELKDGVLSVLIPKKPEGQPKQISVKKT
ncbi:MAG: Hsp20 family protein [Myxococcales bacterium]|nr:Hsp20 family protein [Myxococcales bacterium]MCA9716189.1 Hsp20 family protein [Myxococcales bacterium]MCB9580645.1 Hsp20 family protein [Polyangiaceae bacterium]